MHNRGQEAFKSRVSTQVFSESPSFLEVSFSDRGAELHFIV